MANLADHAVTLASLDKATLDAVIKIDSLPDFTLNIPVDKAEKMAFIAYVQQAVLDLLNANEAAAAEDTKRSQLVADLQGYINQPFPGSQGG